MRAVGWRDLNAWCRIPKRGLIFAHWPGCNNSIFRHPIHHSIPFFDGRLYMVVEVREGHIETPFVLVSLGIRG